MGRADYLKLGDWNALCDYCGHKYKASELRRDWKGLMACSYDWEPRQPQDFVKGVPDNMATPWSRPVPAATFVAVGPAFQGAGLVGTGAAASTSLPVQVAQGNLLVLVVVSTAAPATPTGYTSADAGGVSPNIYVFYKTAGAVENGVTFAGLSATAVAVLLSYNSTSGLDAVSAEATGAGSASTPAITTTVAGDLVMSIFSSATPNRPLASTTPSLPNRVIFSDASHFGLLVVDEVAPVAAPTTPRTATATSGTVAALAVSFLY